MAKSAMFPVLRAFPTPSRNRSMSIEIQAGGSPDDVLAALAPVVHYFGATPTPQDGTRITPFIEPSRAFLAREAAPSSAAARSFPFEMTVPGGVVRTAGLTIGRSPSHPPAARDHARHDAGAARRRPSSRRAGGRLVGLRGHLYGRFGYGMASVSGDIELAKSARGLRAAVRAPRRVPHPRRGRGAGAAVRRLRARAAARIPACSTAERTGGATAGSRIPRTGDREPAS